MSRSLAMVAVLGLVSPAVIFIAEKAPQEPETKPSVSELRASVIRLVDPATGKEVGRIEAKDGKAIFSGHEVHAPTILTKVVKVRDGETGKEQLTLGDQGGMAGLMIKTAEGNQMIALVRDQNGNPNLTMSGGDGQAPSITLAHWGSFDGAEDDPRAFWGLQMTGPSMISSGTVVTPGLVLGGHSYAAPRLDHEALVVLIRKEVRAEMEKEGAASRPK